MESIFGGCTFQTPKIDNDNKINPKLSTTEENGAIYHISQYTDTLERIYQRVCNLFFGSGCYKRVFRRSSRVIYKIVFWNRI